MKKTYQIEVDCANCANLMENAAKKTDGVRNAVVNFMTQKMIVSRCAKRWSQTVRSRCKDRRRAPEADGQGGAFSFSYDSTYT